MILTLAEGSSGYYYVDEAGRVYTRHQFDTSSGRGIGPEPGERPTTKKYQQFAYTTPFWLPTGQVEVLGTEQRAALKEERRRLDLHWLLVEARELAFCPECGAYATREHRILVGGRVPFVCENRHISVDADEPSSERSGKDAVVAIETDYL